MDSIVRVITVKMMMKVILMKMVIMISIVITLSFSGSLPYKDCSPEQQEDNQDRMRGRVQHVY